MADETASDFDVAVNLILADLGLEREQLTETQIQAIVNAHGQLEARRHAAESLSTIASPGSSLHSANATTHESSRAGEASLSPLSASAGHAGRTARGETAVRHPGRPLRQRGNEVEPSMARSTDEQGARALSNGNISDIEAPSFSRDENGEAIGDRSMELDGNAGENATGASAVPPDSIVDLPQPPASVGRRRMSSRERVGVSLDEGLENELIRRRSLLPGQPDEPARYSAEAGSSSLGMAEGNSVPDLRVLTSSAPGDDDAVSSRALSPSSRSNASAESHDTTMAVASELRRNDAQYQELVVREFVRSLLSRARTAQQAASRPDGGAAAEHSQDDFSRRNDLAWQHAGNRRHAMRLSGAAGAAEGAEANDTPPIDDILSMITTLSEMQRLSEARAARNDITRAANAARTDANSDNEGQPSRLSLDSWASWMDPLPQQRPDGGNGDAPEPQRRTTDRPTRVIGYVLLWLSCMFYAIFAQFVGDKIDGDSSKSWLHVSSPLLAYYLLTILCYGVRIGYLVRQTWRPRISRLGWLHIGSELTASLSLLVAVPMVAIALDEKGAEGVRGDVRLLLTPLWAAWGIRTLLAFAKERAGAPTSRFEPWLYFAFYFSILAGALKLDHKSAFAGKSWAELLWLLWLVFAIIGFVVLDMALRILRALILLYPPTAENFYGSFIPTMASWKGYVGALGAQCCAAAVVLFVGTVRTVRVADGNRTESAASALGFVSLGMWLLFSAPLGASLLWRVAKALRQPDRERDASLTTLRSRRRTALPPNYVHPRVLKQIGETRFRRLQSGEDETEIFTRVSKATSGASAVSKKRSRGLRAWFRKRRLRNRGAGGDQQENAGGESSRGNTENGTVENDEPPWQQPGAATGTLETATENDGLSYASRYADDLTEVQNAERALAESEVGTAARRSIIHASAPSSSAEGARGAPPEDDSAAQAGSDERLACAGGAVDDDPSASAAPAEAAPADGQDDELCFICYDNRPNGVLVECGHGGMCVQCLQSCWATSTECPVCRETIVNVCEFETDTSGAIVREEDYILVKPLRTETEEENPV